MYLAYNDLGIFVGGLCRDDKDSISSELVGRDGFGNNDFVGVILTLTRIDSTPLSTLSRLSMSKWTQNSLKVMTMVKISPGIVSFIHRPV